MREVAEVFKGAEEFPDTETEASVAEDHASSQAKGFAAQLPTLGGLSVTLTVFAISLAAKTAGAVGTGGTAQAYNRMLVDVPREPPRIGVTS